jgi:predicted nucleotide-binding protein
MAKRISIEKIEPTIRPSQAIQLLRQHMEKANNLRAKVDLTHSEYESWRNTLHDILKRSLGYPNDTVASIISAGNCLYGLGYSDEMERRTERHEHLDALKDYVEGAIEQLNLNASTQDADRTRPQANGDSSSAISENIFIVHGHAEVVKEQTARLISQLQLNPILLSEQGNEGKTVIEKFESHAESAGYAIVLLTGDDIGAPRSEPAKLKPRARQNVVLELGYFMAKLSRKNVCILYEKGAEIPTDIVGVVYIELDPAESWKYKVAKELKSAGFNVDLNDLA